MFLQVSPHLGIHYNLHFSTNGPWNKQKFKKIQHTTTYSKETSDFPILNFTNMVKSKPNTSLFFPKSFKYILFLFRNSLFALESNKITVLHCQRRNTVWDVSKQYT